MLDVGNIDSTINLYIQKFDRISDELAYQLYEQGVETISTIHLLKDGIIRFAYKRESVGNYIITGITYSEDFTFGMSGGGVCYRIYESDYISK